MRVRPSCLILLRWLLLTCAVHAPLALGQQVWTRPDSAAGRPFSRGVSTTWSKLGDLELIEALRAGGYVLAFRHVETNWHEQDTQRGRFYDCATQRNVSDLGRKDALTLRRAFEALAIPLATVLAKSCWCGCNARRRSILRRTIWT
jgi:hypothetical protein